MSERVFGASKGKYKRCKIYRDIYLCQTFKRKLNICDEKDNIWILLERYIHTWFFGKYWIVQFDNLF